MVFKLTCTVTVDGGPSHLMSVYGLDDVICISIAWVYDAVLRLLPTSDD